MRMNGRTLLGTAAAGALPLVSPLSGPRAQA
jgi:hypothetical protein